MRQRRLRCQSQRGQALTEFVVIALALVPLFLLMPMIGKYQDIAHATAMASRYVAFDAIANNGSSKKGFKSEAQLAAEVRRRFFSNSDAPIKTGDEAGDFNANRNRMWVDPQGEPLIKQFADVTVSFGAGRGAKPADGFQDGSDENPFNVPTPFHTAEELGLKSGIYTANVSVKLANVKELLGSYANTYSELSKLNLSITRGTSLLVDPWTASGAAQIDDRLSNIKIFPASVFNKSPLNVGMKVLDAAVIAMEVPACLQGHCQHAPKVGQLSYWDDVVPADRTK